MRITVSEPAVCFSLTAAISCEPNPRVTVTLTSEVPLPAPSPQPPSRADAARAMARRFIGAVTS